MQKKTFLIAFAVIICVAAAGLCFFHASPKGETIESRERMLNAEISKGNGWRIAKELELDGYIISGAYSTDHHSALAVFEPTGKGSYQFCTSTNRNSREIILSGAEINGKWYDFVWFNGAPTAYAEITYTVNGQVRDTLRYNTDEMEVICCENPGKDYSIQVVYYDRDGNTYE